MSHKFDKDILEFAQKTLTYCKEVDLYDAVLMKDRERELIEHYEMLVFVKTKGAADPVVRKKVYLELIEAIGVLSAAEKGAPIA